MKILYVAHSFPPYSRGSIESHLAGLAGRLSLDHKVSIFYRTNDHRRKEYAVQADTRGSVRLYEFNNTFRGYRSFADAYENPRAAVAFAHTLEALRPDVIHVHSLKHIGVSFLQEAQRRGIPVVFTLHDFWMACPQGQLLRPEGSLCSAIPQPWQCARCVRLQLETGGPVMNAYAFARLFKAEACASKVLKFACAAGDKLVPGFRADQEEKILARRAVIRQAAAGVNRFIAPSDFVQRFFICAGFESSRITLIPHGIALERQPAMMPARQSMRIGFIGSLNPLKGADILIRAFARLKIADAELMIYGGGKSNSSGDSAYARSVRALAHRVPGVYMMGEFSRSQLQAVMGGLDVLAVPSRGYEAASLAALEALALRVPVVAADIGALPEAVQSGINGLLFPPGDVRALSVCLQKSLSPGWRDKISQTMTPVKTMETYARELVELYQKVAAVPA